MRVLIACEESQEVCKAFRAKGHQAYSCDILPCSGGHPEWHLKMDVFQALELKQWDLIIMHPPCTYIAVSGNRWYGKGKLDHYKRIEAVKWTQKLWSKAISLCDQVAMENPVGVLNSMAKFPKPQYIQPYQFGHPESKKTGLWLHNLPDLNPENIVEPEWIVGKDGKKYSRIHYLTKGSAKKYYGADRSTVRSKTFPGIAKAMADQWG